MCRFLPDTCRLTRCIALLCAVMLVSHAHAILFYDTGDPTHNNSAPAGSLANSGWQYEGYFGSYLGTMIAPQYFITAQHIGIAVNTDNGLVVPVIRDVDKKGLYELALEVRELTRKARERKILPAEMQGACFTISSLGGIGGVYFTPIINAPEVAILGVCRARWVPQRGERDAIDWRLMLPLSLSYDHRLINGADAARFTRRLADVLADPANLPA